MSAPVTAKQYDDALRRGELALIEPHAVDATFSARTHVLAIRYTNGLVVSMDVRKNAFLAAYADADLSDPYITPGGDGLIFDRAGVSVSVPGLLAQMLPEDAARRKVASTMGRAPSAKKATAARANGAKGGRPRKDARPA